MRTSADPAHSSGTPSPACRSCPPAPCGNRCCWRACCSGLHPLVRVARHVVQPERVHVRAGDEAAALNRAVEVAHRCRAVVIRIAAVLVVRVRPADLVPAEAEDRVRIEPHVPRRRLVPLVVQVRLVRAHLSVVAPVVHRQPVAAVLRHQLRALRVIQIATVPVGLCDRQRTPALKVVFRRLRVTTLLRQEALVDRQPVAVLHSPVPRHARHRCKFLARLHRVYAPGE